MKAKIKYLFHSGFSIETEKHLLIFDYYNDLPHSENKKLAEGVIGKEDLKGDKDIIVFSSHSHHDHFSPYIMEWSDYNKNIKYILSSDIKPGRYDNNIHLMSPYNELDIGGVNVKTYGSTDMGVSFLVTVDGMRILHAGDLNWWYWWDDTAEEIEKMEKMFKDEIDKISGNEIDIAFFPVDPRLEQNFHMGGEYFIKNLKPEIFVPMHMWEKYKVIRDFKNKIGETNTKILEIDHRGQEFII